MHPTYQNQRHKEYQVDIFPRTKIQHTNTSNAHVKWTSACIMQNNEKCHGISHGSIIGRIIWKLPESYINKNGPIRNMLPTTTNIRGNRQYSDKKHHQRNRKKSREIDMIFYWVRYRIRQNHFCIFCEKGRKNIAEYVKKIHPSWHHRNMIPRYLKVTKKDIENSK